APTTGSANSGLTEPPHTLTVTTQFAPDDGLPRIRWDSARQHLGESAVVEGRLIQGRKNAGGVVLYFDVPRNRSLQLFIRKNALARFPKPPQDIYPGNWVRVAGLIDEFNGTPQMTVADPDLIRILSGEPSPPTPVSQPAGRNDGVIRIGSYNLYNMFDI